MRKNKKRTILKTIDRNKPILVIVSIVLSLILIIGTTYSWITYSDEKINQVESNKKKLSAMIDETFKLNLAWSPGATTEKVLAVENNGQVPTIVRVSLFEYMAQFALDMNDNSGNGGLKISTNSSGKDMIFENVETWEVGNTYKIDDKKYSTAQSVFLSNKNDMKTATVYKGERPELLKYLTIQFNDEHIYSEQNNKLAQDYWYYADGYFYYSEVLQPNEKTKPLIQSVTIDGKLPNRYKGSFYQLIPVMDAHDITKSLVEDWQISSDNVKDLYSTKLH